MDFCGRDRRRRRSQLRGGTQLDAAARRLPRLADLRRLAKLRATSAVVTDLVSKIEVEGVGAFCDLRGRQSAGIHYASGVHFLCVLVNKRTTTSMRARVHCSWSALRADIGPRELVNEDR